MNTPKDNNAEVIHPIASQRVSDTEKCVDEILRHGKPTAKTATQSTNHDMFGVTPAADMPRPETVKTTNKTIDHTLMNAAGRLEDRSKAITSGIAGETISLSLAGISMGLSAFQGGGVNATSMAAVAASSLVIGILALRKHHNSQDKNTLKQIARSYNPKKRPPEEEDGRIIQLMEENDLGIDTQHRMSDKELNDRRLEFLTTKQQPKSKKALVKQYTSKALSITKDVGNDLINTPKNLPNIAVNTSKGAYSLCKAAFKAKTLHQKADTNNLVLLGALGATYLSELSFVGLSVVQGTSDISVSSGMSLMAAFASLLPLSQLGQEVDTDVNKLLAAPNAERRTVKSALSKTLSSFSLAVNINKPIDETKLTRTQRIETAIIRNKSEFFTLEAV